MTGKDVKYLRRKGLQPCALDVSSSVWAPTARSVI